MVHINRPFCILDDLVAITEEPGTMTILGIGDSTAPKNRVLILPAMKG